MFVPAPVEDAVPHTEGSDPVLSRSVITEALRVHFFATPLQLIIPPPAVTTRTAISPDAGAGKG